MVVLFYFYFIFSGQAGLSVLPFPYAYPGGGVPWGAMYPGLVQQQQSQNGGSGSTTPGPGGGRRPGSPSSGTTTNGTVTPGPPELQNGGLTNGTAAAAGVPPIHLFPAGAAYIDPTSGAYFSWPPTTTPTHCGNSRILLRFYVKSIILTISSKVDFTYRPGQQPNWEYTIW